MHVIYNNIRYNNNDKKYGIITYQTSKWSYFSGRNKDYIGIYRYLNVYGVGNILLQGELKKKNNRYLHIISL